MTPKHAVWMLIAVTALVRLICAISLGLGNDEAYHFLYAAHPALSYYDHPPMMAWVEMLGLAMPGGGASSWAMRIGFIVLFAGSTWLLARLTSRYYGAMAGFLAAFALNVSGYYGLAASTFALPDGPLLFFWLLTIDRLECRPRRARVQPADTLDLGGPGLGRGHAEQVSRRLHAFGSGPLRPARSADAALAVPAGPVSGSWAGAVLFSPVIVWNAGHGWASFLFQGGRAVGSGMFRPDYLMVALLAQAVYLFPWIWVPLVVILVRECRHWRRIAAGHERLWLCLAIVPLGVFTLVACFRPVLPHWGLIGLVALLPILGRNWSARLEKRPEPTRRIARRLCRLFPGFSGLHDRRVPVRGASARS